MMKQLQRPYNLKNIITAFSEPPETEDRIEDGAAKVAGLFCSRKRDLFFRSEIRPALRVHKFPMYLFALSTQSSQAVPRALSLLVLAHN